MLLRQTKITATVFGGAGDEQPSAYPDVAPGWPDRPGVALPMHITGVRPRVRVFYGDKSVVCEVVDVGPWYPSARGPANPYWVDGSRPRSEQDMHTNHAGIDLTPAAAKALGIDGKGIVDWQFELADVAVPKAKDPQKPASPLTPTISVGGWIGVLLAIIKAIFGVFFPAKKPPTQQPANSTRTAGSDTIWMDKAKSFIGFHEKGENQGLEELIALAHTGSEGDPWCAIFVNACLESAGIRGSRSPAARSFEHDANFVKLSGPAYGAIVTNWRGSPAGGLGHVFFYAGESPSGIYALGGNQSDQVMYQFESRDHVVGYFWPVSVPLPIIGPIPAGTVKATTGSVT